MFNPTNMDEVCVKDTHIESISSENFPKNPFNLGGIKFKGKGKGKKMAIMNQGEDKPTYTHC